MISYDKTQIKEQLSLDNIFTLLVEWGGEPELTSFGIMSTTICHNAPFEGSRKLYYYSNSGMCELEKLMYSSAENCKSNGNISVISCENTRQEALAAANIIRREVKNNGYRFKDFIVVARNANDYDDNVLRQCLM